MPTDDWILVHGDPDQLRNILRNLSKEELIDRYINMLLIMTGSPDIFAD